MNSFVFILVSSSRVVVFCRGEERRESKRAKRELSLVSDERQRRRLFFIIFLVLHAHTQSQREETRRLPKIIRSKVESEREERAHIQMQRRREREREKSLI